MSQFFAGKVLELYVVKVMATTAGFGNCFIILHHIKYLMKITSWLFPLWCLPPVIYNNLQKWDFFCLKDKKIPWNCLGFCLSLQLYWKIGISMQKLWTNQETIWDYLFQQYYIESYYIVGQKSNRTLKLLTIWKLKRIEKRGVFGGTS